MIADSHTRLPPVLRRLWVWLVALSLGSASFTLIATYTLHKPGDATVLWLLNPDRFTDFTLFQRRFTLFGTPAFWRVPDYPFTYPAATALVFQLLFQLPHALRCFLALECVALLGWASWLARLLRHCGVRGTSAAGFAATVLITCYPAVFLLDTANIEGVVVVFCGCGMLACLRGRWTMGSVLIGFAAGMKIYPLVLLGLALSRRRWGAFAAGLGVAALANLLALWMLGPTISGAQRDIDAGLRYVHDVILLSTVPGGLPFNHSPWEAIMVGLARMLHSRAWLDPALACYTGIAAIAGLALYFGLIRRLPMLNQVLALTACAVLLPPLSGDYTLLQLLVPFTLLCAYAAGAHRRGLEVRGLRVALASFALIFPWNTFFDFHYLFESQFRTLGLMALLATVVLRPFPELA